MSLDGYQKMDLILYCLYSTNPGQTLAQSSPHVLTWPVPNVPFVVAYCYIKEKWTKIEYTKKKKKKEIHLSYIFSIICFPHISTKS
jgi:hypothetical protein